MIWFIELAWFVVICKGEGKGLTSEEMSQQRALDSRHVSVPTVLKTPGGTRWVIIVWLTCFHKPPFHPLPYIGSFLSGFISDLLVKPFVFFTTDANNNKKRNIDVSDNYDIQKYQ